MEVEAATLINAIGERLTRLDPALVDQYGPLLVHQNEKTLRRLQNLSDQMLRAALPGLTAPVAEPSVGTSAGPSGAPQQPMAPAGTAVLTRNDLVEMLPQLAEQVADVIGKRLYLPVELSASECRSADWDRLEPQLGTVVHLDLTRAAPCCLPCQPLDVPAFVWPANKEDDPRTITAALNFLGRVLPPWITVVPVQGVKWLNGSFHLATINLIITGSKTDYLLVYSVAWDALMQQLGIHVDGHQVSDTIKLRDHLPRLLPWVLGFYEAKTPTVLTREFRKCRAQAILEHMAAWHMLSFKASPIVLFGDFSRTYCVHSGGSLRDLPSIHVAGPRLPVVPEGQQVVPGNPYREIWGMVRALLEQAKQTLQSSGVSAVDITHQGPQQLVGVAVSSSTALGASGQPGGAWGLTRSGSVDRVQVHDTEMEEAALLNLSARQLMSVMRHPEIYSSLGLDSAPSTYEPGAEEDVWAQLQVLTLKVSDAEPQVEPGSREDMHQGCPREI